MSGIAESSKMDIHESLECSICAQLFKEPKQLSCGHTFCSACIEKMISTIELKSMINCPHCRKITYVPTDGLSTNYVIGDLVAKFETVNLEAAKMNGNCFMCQTSVSKTQLVVCSVCSNESFCSMCMLKYHQGHSYRLFSSFAAQKRLSNACGYVERQKNVCKVYMDRMAFVNDSCTSSMRQISEVATLMFSKLENILSTLKDADETSSESELCALLARARQAKTMIDAIFTRSTAFENDLQAFLRSVNGFAELTDQNEDNNCAVYSEIKAILDDDSLSALSDKLISVVAESPNTATKTDTLINLRNGLSYEADNSRRILLRRKFRKNTRTRH